MELQRLIKSAFPPTHGVSEALVGAVYKSLEFYPTTDEGALWGNSAVAEPDAETAGRGLINALRTAAESVAFAHLSSINNDEGRAFADEVMKEREKANRLHWSTSPAQGGDAAWSDLSPQTRFGKFGGPGGVDMTNSSTLEAWENR